MAGRDLSPKRCLQCLEFCCGEWWRTRFVFVVIVGLSPRYEVGEYLAVDRFNGALASVFVQNFETRLICRSMYGLAYIMLEPRFAAFPVSRSSWRYVSYSSNTLLNDRD